MTLSKNFFKNFFFSEMPENFRNAPKPNFDLHVISFICTNFEVFTTFSPIFTRIRCTTRPGTHWGGGGGGDKWKGQVQRDKALMGGHRPYGGGT